MEVLPRHRDQRGVAGMVICVEFLHVVGQIRSSHTEEPTLLEPCLTWAGEQYSVYMVQGRRNAPEIVGVDRIMPAAVDRSAMVQALQ